MKPINGYDKVKRNTNDFFEKLPPDGYICKILSAKVQKFGDGEKLVIAFDICEGAFEGFFDKQYNESTFEDKRWKGTLGLWLPKDDGTEKDEKNKERFKSSMCDIEDSNIGYTWNWDEKTLKGKKVGILFNEGEYNGHRYTKAYATRTVATICEGKFRIWQPELTAHESSPAVTNNDSEEYDLPF